MGARRKKARSRARGATGLVTTGSDLPEVSDGRFADRSQKVPPENRITKRWVIAGGLLLLLLAGQIAITAQISVPGFLVIDEVIYEWMARDLHATGGMALQTGFAETPSPELYHALHMRVRDGNVYAQYPQLFALLAAPFVGALGLYALIALNSVAFAGVVGLCWALAWELFADARRAWAACFILVFGTFSWEYSQQAWPHSFATLFSTAALYLALLGLRSAGRRAAWLAFAAGLVTGLGIGIRLDVVFVLPCIVLPFAFASPVRLREILSVLVGAAPCLAALGAVNSIKFGTWNPLAYGPTAVDSNQHVPFGLSAFLAAGVLVVWVFSRPSLRLNRRRRSRLIGVVGLIVVAVIAASPSVRGALATHTRTLAAFLGDLRLLPSDQPMPAMEHSRSGAVMYIGAYKKAVLQSTPYLAALLLPLLEVIRSPRRSWELAYLLQLPVVTAVGLTAFSFHGGLCLNMRYFLPIFPVSSILVVWVVNELLPKVEFRSTFGVLGIAAAAAAAVAVAAVAGRLAADLSEELILIGPLILALATAIAVVAAACARGKLRRWTAKVATFLVAAGITWSGVVAFGYDLPRHRQQRINNLEVGRRVAELVPPHTFFFTAPYIDPFMKLIEAPDTVIALPAQDDMKDLPRLVDHSLGSGRRVFGVLRLGEWRGVAASRLARFHLQPQWSFEERFDHGPTLHDAGPFREGGDHSPTREFVLVEVFRKPKRTPDAR